VLLQVPLVDVWYGLPVESIAASIGDDADDCNPFVVAAAPVLAFDPLAYGVLAGPVAASHALIDYRDQRRGWPVMLGKIAAPEQRRSHGLKIVASNALPY